MARYLLDTDATIDYLQGFAPSISLIQDLHNQGNLLCVCDVVIAEVYSGLRTSDRKKAARLLDACFFCPPQPRLPNKPENGDIDMPGGVSFFLLQMFLLLLRPMHIEQRF